MYCCNSSSVAKWGLFLLTLKCGCIMSETWGIRTVVLKSVFRMNNSGLVIRFRSSSRVISPQNVFSKVSPRLLTTGKPQWVQPRSIAENNMYVGSSKKDTYEWWSNNSSALIAIFFKKSDFNFQECKLIPLNMVFWKKNLKNKYMCSNYDTSIFHFGNLPD